MRPAGPKSMEDDHHLSGKTEDAGGKGDHLSDGGKSLPGRPTVSETKPGSTNVKMRTFNKEKAKENPARSTLGGPRSVHGDCQNLHRPEPSVKDKEGSDYLEEGSCDHEEEESSDHEEEGSCDYPEKGSDHPEEGSEHEEKSSSHPEEGSDHEEEGSSDHEEEGSCDYPEEGSEHEEKSSVHPEEGSFRGGKDMLESKFKNEEDGREILAKEIKNVENSRGRRPGAGAHGHHNNLEVGNKEEKQNSFRGGIEALKDHPGSTMGKVDNLAKEAKNTGKPRGSTPDNKTPRRSNRSAVDKAGRQQEEVNSFRGGTEPVPIESESKEEKTQTFANNTNITEEGPEIFPGVLRSARSRGLTCKGAAPRCPTRPEKNDEICTSGRADHPPRPIPRPARPIPRPARPIPRPANPNPRPPRPIWTENKTVFLVLLICGQFMIAVSAGSLPDRSAGRCLYQFCVSSADLTDDRLKFHEQDTMRMVCRFQSGKVLYRTSSNCTISLHNKTCAHMETTDPEPVTYVMEYGDGETCHSVLLDSPEVSESYQKINQSNDQTNITEDTSPPREIILCPIAVTAGLILILVVLGGIYLYRKTIRQRYKSVRTDIKPRDIDVESNDLQSTPGDEDASRNGNANGVQSSSV